MLSHCSVIGLKRHLLLHQVFLENYFYLILDLELLHMQIQMSLSFWFLLCMTQTHHYHYLSHSLQPLVADLLLKTLECY
jgi:hypothetical protein